MVIAALLQSVTGEPLVALTLILLVLLLVASSANPFRHDHLVPVLPPIADATGSSLSLRDGVTSASARLVDPTLAVSFSSPARCNVPVIGPMAR